MAIERLHIIEQERPRIDKVDFHRRFRKAVHFQELDKNLVVLQDKIGLTRRLPSGKLETYSEKLEEDHRKSGKNDSASYGVARIGNQEFVLISSDWDFMGGTAGAVMTEKVIRATRLAKRKNVPLVFACSTGGQRMQEGPAALANMETVSFALDEFIEGTIEDTETDEPTEEQPEEKPYQPYIFIVVGDVWGGLTAGAEAKADIVIGMAGSNNGFAGRDAIKAYEGQEPPLNSQTVEIAQATHRGVHVILNDQKELIAYLKGVFDQVNGTYESPKLVKAEVNSINLDQEGYHTPIAPLKRVRGAIARKDIPMLYRPVKEPKTAADFDRDLLGDVTRVDPAFAIAHIFAHFSAIWTDHIYDAMEDYEGEANPDRIRRYLARQHIIAALATLEDDALDEPLQVMVMGHQPTIYQRTWDEKFMLDQPSSNPRSWDYWFQRDMTKFAERLDRPIILFPGTPGARPTIEDERMGVARSIEDAKKALYRASVFTSSYLLGPGGSGGYEGSKGIDHVVMLNRTTVRTAESKSATGFLHPRMEIDYKDVIRTANGMRATAADLYELGLIHGVVDEVPRDPFATAQAIKNDIVATHLENKDRPFEEIKRARRPWILDRHPIPVGPRPRSRWDRIIHH